MDYSQLKNCLTRICQNIGGNWVLLGGSLVRFDIDPNRGTHDIDIVNLSDKWSPKDQANFILEMKAEGLSPEQVNSSVQFFLNQFADWQAHLVPLYTYAKGRILRPNLTLFCALKMMRSSEIDIRDLQLAAQRWGMMEFNREQFIQWCGNEMLIKLEKHLQDITSIS